MTKKEIIAEIGSVHDGSLGNAIKLIDCASNCGAHTVKFQLHISSEEMTNSAKNPPYFKSESRKLYFDRIQFTENQLKKIIGYCKKKKINFLCSPFSVKALEILEKLNVDSYKIASGEVSNIYLLKKIANTNKKVYLSTGMSNYEDIDRAAKIFKRNNLVIMQCTSQYPCHEKKVGLNNIKIFKEKYRCKIGFSDHYEGFAAGFAAAALGASVIEKHITFSKLMYGSDAQFAMEPNDFKNYVKGIKNIWLMNESPVDKNDLEYLKDMKRIFEKSIYTAKDLKKNSILKIGDISFKKPGIGIEAFKYKLILGKKIKRDLKIDHKINFSDLE